MVPSDPIRSPCPPPACPALNIAIGSAERFASPLPSSVFPSHRFNASWRVAAFLLSPSGLVARNGLSLAHNDSRLRETHSGVKGPDLLLRSLLPASPARSALPLHYPEPVRPGPGRFIASGPLQRPQVARLMAPSASTPLWDFYLPRDQSVQRNLPPAKPAFRIRPISSRSPQPVSITRSLGCGSPFLVRYVSGGLLFLKPLGTSPNMRLPHFLVKLLL